MNNKKQKSPLVYLSGTCLVTICVCSVGYSAYLITTTATKEAGVGVVAPEVIKDSSGITIHITQNNSNVMFDSMYSDTSGRVTSDSESERTPTIEVIGYVDGYTNDKFIGINPVLQVDEDDREAYDYLVDNDYIVEPSFSQLGKTDNYDASLSAANSFCWTSAASAQRTFILNYEYAYGSFFDYMNPSEFFDSTHTNSVGKKGRDYSTSEIREILSRFEDVNDAKYTLYLDIMTEGSLFDVIVDAGSGHFSSTDTSTTYSISNLTYHSKVEPITPYLDDYIFQYWKYGSSSTEYTGYFYINELATFSVGTTITLTAQYKAASSSFSVMFDKASSGASVTFNVQSEDGISTYTWAYGDTTSISLSIGDVITVTNTTAVSSISASSSVGLTRINSTTFRVTASTCSLYVITIPSYKVTFQLSTSTDLTFINFMAGDTEVQWTSTSGFPTFAVAQGESLTLSNVRGVSSFSDGSSSGSSLTITPTSDTTITITPATACKLTVKFTSGGYDVSFNVKCQYTYDNSTRTVTFAEFSGLSSTNNSLGTYYYVSGETWIIDGQDNVDSVSAGTTSDTSTSATITSDTTVTVTAESNGCLLPGTLVTMADLSYKPIEDIEVGDEVLVFDHMTGRIGTAPVAIKVNEESKTDVLVMSLYFSNGRTVNVVVEHGFFDVDLNKYIYVNEETYKDYVGHRFYAVKGNGSIEKEMVTLESVDTFFTAGRLYEIVSRHTVNTFTEDMLSIPGVATGIFNYLDLDENMKVDIDKMKADIAMYGLYTYDDWKEYITEEEFDALNVRYLKISIGKGITTFETLIAQAALYLGH